MKNVTFYIINSSYIVNARNLAIWFIANNIKNSPECGWNQDTRISEEELVRDENNNIISYIFKLQNNFNDNGYVVVSGSSSMNLISEFSYEGSPLFYDLIEMPRENKEMEKAAPILSEAKDANNIIDFSDENAEYLNTVRNTDMYEIFNGKDTKKEKGYFESSSKYGGITDPYKHVNDTYGDGWSYSSSDTISGFKLLDMDNFNARMHCSLTSLTAIFNYHRGHGYSNIESNIDQLFKDIKKIGEDEGYYDPDGTGINAGTNPTKIDNLAIDVWKKYGYNKATADNDFFFWDTNSIANTLKDEVEANRPGTISFTSGTYENHTVTYYGYKEYKKGSSKRCYLKVNDNWSTSGKYVDVNQIGKLGSSFFEICKVIPKK